MPLDIGSLAALIGSVMIDCSVCGRELTLRVHDAPGTFTRGSLTLPNVAVDEGALHAHYLTHGPHDGEPLPQAA